MQKAMMIVAASSAMALASAALASSYSFSSIGETYFQDFNSYMGTEATMPAHMFVTGENGAGDQYPGPFNPFTGVSSLADTSSPTWGEGFTAFTNGASGNSFGIRERGQTDLRDSRLFFEFTNNTGQAITGFNVSYDVEVWFHGQRANRIRMKYNTDTSGFSDIDDLTSTVNPLGPGGSGEFVDGSLEENRTEVSVFVDLIALGFGPLADGETAFFRWQYSNADGDSGSLRSGLALNNLSITAVPAPAAFSLFGVASLVGAGRRRKQ